ncbi:MAG: class I SAM-dependent methyltransferase [Balneolaceae bacterium]
MTQNSEIRTPDCILCESGETSHLCREESRRMRMRDFYRCGNCRLVFVHPEQRLSPEEEFSRYELHENDPDDPAYRGFLNRMFEPLSKKLSPGSFGLDFGSGPGPALSRMLEEEGHTVRIYDPFYADDPSVFDETYDFITSTETAEHLFRPRWELDRLWSCLKSGGWLGIMTSLAPDDEQFAGWHYKNDDTHVTFYARESFEWLKRRWKAGLEFSGESVMLFRKNG